MATKLTKSITREVTITDGGSLDGLTFIVTLGPEGIVFRQKNKVHRVLLPYSSAWVKAQVLAADAAVAKKPKRRVSRSLLRRS